MVVAAPEQPVGTEVKVLLAAVSGDTVRERRPQAAPNLIAGRINRAAFTVQVDGHPGADRLLDEAFEAPKFATCDDVGRQGGELAPALKAAICLQDLGKQWIHGNFLSSCGLAGDAVTVCCRRT